MAQGKHPPGNRLAQLGHWPDTAWAMGVGILHRLKRAGLAGPFANLLAWLGPRIIPPPRRAVEVALPLGLRMHVPPGLASARTYALGRYEPEVTLCFMRLVRPGMTVVDVGANVGYYTLLASRLTKHGAVYSFEPYPPAFQALVANIEANGCHNVTAVQAAVSDSPGPHAFRIDPYGTCGHLAPDEGDIAVPCVTLDDYFAAAGWPAVHLVKMDIEGGEAAALRGMRILLQRNPRLVLIMELNWPALERAKCSYREMASLLYDLGFREGYIIERGMMPFALPHQLPRTRHACNLLLAREAGNKDVLPS